MKKIKYLLIILLISGIEVHAQGIYKTILDAGADENPRTITIGHDNKVVICGKSNMNNKTFGWAYLLDSSGNYMNDVSVTDPDFSVEFRHTYKTNNGYRFLGVKQSFSGSFSQHIFIYETDKNLTPIDSSKVFLSDTLKVIGYRIFQDKDTNYIYHGYAELIGGVSPPIPFIFKIDKNGNILHQQMGHYSNFTGWLNYNLLENFEGDGYLLFCQKNKSNLNDPPLALNINPDLSVKSSGHIKLPDSIQLGNVTSSMWDYYDVVKFNDKIVFIARAGLYPEDFYLTKIDTNGNILEMVIDEGEHDYYLHGGINTLDYKDDHIYISYQDSGRSDMDFPPFTNKIIVRKADTSLNIVWEKRLGWDAYYWHSDIYATDDGGCLVMASVYDKDTMSYQNDIILYKLDADGNVTNTHRIEDAAGQSLSVYPNPGDDYFSFNLPVGKATLQVFNPNGKLLLEQSLTGKGRQKIDMQQYASGVYFLRLIDEKQRIVGNAKWIKR